MSEKTLKFGNIEVNKIEFHVSRFCKHRQNSYI